MKMTITPKQAKERTTIKKTEIERAIAEKRKTELNEVLENIYPLIQQEIEASINVGVFRAEICLNNLKPIAQSNLDGYEIADALSSSLQEYGWTISCPSDGFITIHWD